LQYFPGGQNLHCYAFCRFFTIEYVPSKQFGIDAKSLDPYSQ